MTSPRPLRPVRSYSVSVYDRATGEHLMWCGTFAAPTPAVAKGRAFARQAAFSAYPTFGAALHRPQHELVLRARRTNQPPMFTEEI